MISKECKVFVAGHTGLAGSALLRQLKAHGYNNLIYKKHSELELTDQVAVLKFMGANQPDVVFLAAAIVGGINANNTRRGEFFYSNMQIQTNVIEAAKIFGVKKLVFLGSVCIYPKFAEQPVTEESLLSGELEPTNSAYAVAKIGGIQMCRAYNHQYGTNFVSIMPCNMYGPGDNYDDTQSHVLPGLLSRFHKAKMENAPKVVCWGTGEPRREFLYSDDMADAAIMVLESDTKEDLINISPKKDISIRALVAIVKDIVGYNGEIEWDTSKPDGTPARVMDNSKITALGWKPKMSLVEGIARTYKETFLKG